MKAFCYSLLWLVAIAAPVSRAAAEETLRLEPAGIVLDGADARQQLLVTMVREGRESDATDEAMYASADPKVVAVDSAGVVRPVADGVTKITATLGGHSAALEVKVVNAARLPPVHFAHDVIPLLTKAGCNSGACHGKQSGQNGFKLSVFGHDEQADYQALVNEGRGRRLFPASPEQSLLLGKATNRVPHGGGRRLDEASPEFRRLVRWIAAGAPTGEDDAPKATAIEVLPRERVMLEKSRQRLVVTATLSDGTRRDVTSEALYSSNDETLAVVDPEGRISTTSMTGQSAIVVRYHELVAACFVTVPLNSAPNQAAAASLAQWNRTQFIDRLVAEKWDRLGLAPSPPADDATFLRRVHLDLIGKLPSPVEVTTYLADARPNKRTLLVDALLARPEYADYWALKWADLLRINREDLGAKSAYYYHGWLRDSLARNQPYDEFVRELITAQGSGERNRAVNFYKAFANPTDLAVAVSQVFLGVRLECAKCHHHPYEKWGQDDFYGLAAFFPRLQKKAGAELSLYVVPTGDVKHPRTQVVVSPRVLLGQPLEVAPDADPRGQLAAWMAAPDNPFVARTLVNRIWSHLMGRGLVEPIDDMRDTNPATNEPLLVALTRDFVSHKFDVRHLIRTIVNSQVYALSSHPNAGNARDTQNYSRFVRKRLSAEVLLDAVCDATGQAESFAGMPPGTRAVALWDHRLPSAFLDTFGRPQRKTVCQCERVSDATLGQVLHLLNAPLVNDKISSPTGRAAKLAAGDRAADELITELYLAVLGRPPREAELSAARAAFASPGATRRTAAEDVLWALMNSAEFVLNH